MVFYFFANFFNVWLNRRHLDARICSRCQSVAILYIILPLENSAVHSWGNESEKASNKNSFDFTVKVSPDHTLRTHALSQSHVAHAVRLRAAPSGLSGCCSRAQLWLLPLPTGWENTLLSLNPKSPLPLLPVCYTSLSSLYESLLWLKLQGPSRGQTNSPYPSPVFPRWFSTRSYHHLLNSVS